MSYTVETNLRDSMAEKAADEFQNGALKIYSTGSPVVLLLDLTLPAALSATNAVIDLTAGGTLSNTVEAGVLNRDPDYFTIEAGGDGVIGAGTVVVTGDTGSAGSGSPPSDIEFDVFTGWNAGDTVEVATATWTTF
jgi:hypothetical protein